MFSHVHDAPCVGLLAALCVVHSGMLCSMDALTLCLHVQHARLHHASERDKSVVMKWSIVATSTHS